MSKGKIVWLKAKEELSDDADIYADLFDCDFNKSVEVDEDTQKRWNAIEKLDGTIEYGECLYCGKEKGMHFNKGWFFCKTCHDCVPAEVYYQWYAGFDVYLER